MSDGDEETTGSDDEETTGSDDEETTGSDDEETTGSDDEETAGSDDEETAGSDDEETAAATGDRLSQKFGEPAEFDPAERFGDPEQEASVPEPPDNPADRLPDPSEVDSDVQNAFWRALLWTNVAVAGLTLGPAYAILDDGTRVGAAATVIGAVAAVRVYQTVRAFKRRDRDEDTDDGGTNDGDADDSDTNDGGTDDSDTNDGDADDSDADGGGTDDSDTNDSDVDDGSDTDPVDEPTP